MSTIDISVFILLAGIVITFGYWLYRLATSGTAISRIGSVLFSCEGISVIATSVLVANAYMMDRSDSDFYGQLRFLLIAWSPLFILPFLYLTFVMAMKMKLPRLITFITSLFLPLVYVICDIILHVFVDWKMIESTPWMYFFDMSVYNLIIIYELIYFFVAYYVRFWRYKKRMCNYFSNPSATDYKAVTGLVRIVAFTFIGLYSTFLVGFSSLVNNAFFCILLLLICLYIINHLGIHLNQLKGITIPKNILWKNNTFTPEQLEAMEEKMKRLEVVEEARVATVDIDKTLSGWIEDENMYYLKSGITINDVAEQTKVPAKLISVYLNKTLNLNFNSWVNIHRMKHVKRLLITTSMTLEEIAKTCGFTDRSALTRTFTKLEGVSPKDFRNKNGKKQLE